MSKTALPLGLSGCAVQLSSGVKTTIGTCLVNRVCEAGESWEALGEEDTGFILEDPALALPPLESGLFSYNSNIWVECCPFVTPSNSVLARVLLHTGRLLSRFSLHPQYLNPQYQ